MSTSFKLLFLIALLLAPAAQSAQPEAPATPPIATDPTYRISLGDSVVVTVFGEPELGATQMVDREGNVRLPLIGTLTLAGRSVREAESFIEETYRQQELIKLPQVTVSLGAYARREVAVIGAVRTPGTLVFPPDAVSLDIRDVIARQGGFMPVAKGDAVAVTRRQADGTETTTVLDVERMMSGRAKPDAGSFLIYSGDRIFVPERLF